MPYPYDFTPPGGFMSPMMGTGFPMGPMTFGGPSLLAQPGGMFQQQVALGMRPFVQGAPAPFFDPFASVMPNWFGPMGQMAGSMALQQFMTPMMNRVGMMPMGFGGQNVYDVMQMTRMQQAQDTVLRQTAQLERGAYMRTAQGALALGGVPFDADQQRAAGQFADLMTTAAPTLAVMAPELLEQMGGMRGSPTVMAQRMMMGGRYRMDPVTGRMGMTPEAVTRMAQQIYQRTYERGDIGEMRGITAGQLGSMFDEFTRRGMIAPGPTGPEDIRAALRGLQARDVETGGDVFRQAMERQGLGGRALAGLTPVELQTLRRQEPEVAGTLQNVDARRIERKLKDYVGVVSAMRDIFGDMGRPNAPIQELLAGLEALTAGSFQQLTPQQAQRMVRETAALAQQTGLGMDQAMMMTQQAQGMAMQYGLNPLFGVQAMQYGMTTVGGMQRTGQFETPRFGRLSQEKFGAIAQQRYLGAAASERAQTMAAVTLLESETGEIDPKTGERRWGQGTFGRAMSDAIRRQDPNFIYKGKQYSTARQNREALSQMMAQELGGVGVTETTLERLFRDTPEIQEQIFRYDIAGFVAEEEQPRDLLAGMQAGMQRKLVPTLREKGLGDEDALLLANVVGRAAGAELVAMPSTERDKPEVKRKRMADKAREAVEADESLSDELKQRVRTMGDREIGLLMEEAERGGEDFVRENQRLKARYEGNVLNMAQDISREGREAKRRERDEARMSSMIRDAVSGFGQGTMVQRMMDALQKLPDDAERNDQIASVAAQIAGGVPKEAIRDKLLPLLDAWVTKKQELEARGSELQALPETTEQERTAKAEAMSRWRTDMEELVGQRGDIMKTAASMGIDPPEKVKQSQAPGGTETQKTDLLGKEKQLRDRATSGHDHAAERLYRTMEGGRQQWEAITKIAKEKGTTAAQMLADPSKFDIGAEGLDVLKQYRKGVETAQTLAKFVGIPEEALAQTDLGIQREVLEKALPQVAELMGAYREVRAGRMSSEDLMKLIGPGGESADVLKQVPRSIIESMPELSFLSKLQQLSQGKEAAQREAGAAAPPTIEKIEIAEGALTISGTLMLDTPEPGKATFDSSNVSGSMEPAR